jgi:hypothetical protein
LSLCLTNCALCQTALLLLKLEKEVKKKRERNIETMLQKGVYSVTTVTNQNLIEK